MPETEHSPLLTVEPTNPWTIGRPYRYDGGWWVGVTLADANAAAAAGKVVAAVTAGGHPWMVQPGDADTRAGRLNVWAEGLNERQVHWGWARPVAWHFADEPQQP